MGGPAGKEEGHRRDLGQKKDRVDPIGLFSSGPHPNSPNAQVLWCPLKASLFTGVPTAAPSRRQSPLRDANPPCLEKFPHERDGANAGSTGRGVWGCRPGFPCSARGALRLRRTLLSSLSSPTESCGLLWLGGWDRTGASGLGLWEGLYS